MTERAEIVAWLRKEAAFMDAMSCRETASLQFRYEAECEAKQLRWLANRVERGEHMEGSSDGE